MLTSPHVRGELMAERDTMATSLPLAWHTHTHALEAHGHAGLTVHAPGVDDPRQVSDLYPTTWHVHCRCATPRRH